MTTQNGKIPLKGKDKLNDMHAELMKWYKKTSAGKQDSHKTIN